MYYDHRTGGRTYSVIVFEDADGDVGYSPEYFAAQSEHVTLQTGGSWGSAVGAYVGGEHTAPMPFTGWAGAL